MMSCMYGSIMEHLRAWQHVGGWTKRFEALLYRTTVLSRAKMTTEMGSALTIY